MSALATWGPKIFKVSTKQINTFAALTRNVGIETEEKEQGSSKPLLHNKYKQLESMSFEQVLSYLYVDVKKEIESWINLIGKDHYFILGKNKYGDFKWELLSVDISEQIIAPNGMIKSAKVSLSFKEKGIKRAKKTTAKSTRNKKG